MNDYQIKKVLIEKQNEQQRDYFSQLLDKEKETRRFRHDIINDLLVLQNYCDKKDYDSMELYLTQTLGAVEKISKSNYDVGNDIINTILNYYLLPVKAQCEVCVEGVIQEEIAIEQRDLCILIANLVKNAVEAVKELRDAKIMISMNKGKKYFSVQVKNTFDGEIKLDKNGFPETRKKDKHNHGIGIESVMRIVHKYRGSYRTEVNEEMYKVEIFLEI
jgi:sensor histidine kinase regulating citrate/malate metabolism